VRDLEPLDARVADRVHVRSVLRTVLRPGIPADVVEVHTTRGLLLLLVGVREEVVLGDVEVVERLVLRDDRLGASIQPFGYRRIGDPGDPLPQRRLCGRTVERVLHDRPVRPEDGIPRRQRLIQIAGAGVEGISLGKTFFGDPVVGVRVSGHSPGICLVGRRGTRCIERFRILRCGSASRRKEEQECRDDQKSDS